MTDLFSPRRQDGRAEWKVIYDEVHDLPYGAEITFAAIAKLLGDDDRSRAYRAVRRCNQQLGRESRPRILGSCRGNGYRVLKPDEYAPAALSYQAQARRKLSSAVSVMQAAPLRDMTTAQRDWAHKVTMVLIDNELRLRSQEQWRDQAEQRLAALERRAGIPKEG